MYCYKRRVLFTENEYVVRYTCSEFYYMLLFYLLPRKHIVPKKSDEHYFLCWNMNEVSFLLRVS